MNYYAMFKNDINIGVINSLNFKFINPKTHKTIIVPENQACCIEYNNNYYCTLSMPIVQMGDIPYTFIYLLPITEEEYNEYLEFKESDENKQIIYPDIPAEPVPEPQPESDLVQHKMTIQEMRDKITAQEQQINMLIECILEMSEQVYNE